MDIKYQRLVSSQDFLAHLGEHGRGTKEIIELVFFFPEVN